MKTPWDSTSTPAPQPSRATGSGDASALDWAREAGESERVIRDLETFLVRRRRLHLAVTSAALVAFGLLAWPVLRSRIVPPPQQTAIAANAVVLRPETRQLSDGTVVELNGGAELAVDFSGPLRRVTLHRGAAHFQVAKDPQRTFVVVAGGVEVRAVGTAFSVGVEPRTIEVLVTEGHVAVENTARAAPTATATAAATFTGSGAAPVYGAGNRIRVDVDPAGAAASGPQASAVSAEEMEQELAWRVPRLEFAGTSLTQALPMFNAHGRVRLALADPALGRLQLSGVLRADDTESLLRLLEGEFGLIGERRGKEIVLRRR